MGNHKQHIREYILSQIPITIENLLHHVDSTPTRILGDAPNRILDPEDYVGSLQIFVSTVEEALRRCRPESKITVLAVQIYPERHSYFAIDLNNLGYNYEAAHKNLSPIPVYLLRLSKKKSTSIFRQPVLDTTIAHILATLHNSHGYEPLPLFDDNNQSICYSNPRSLQS